MSRRSGLAAVSTIVLAATTLLGDLDLDERWPVHELRPARLAAVLAAGIVAALFALRHRTTPTPSIAAVLGWGLIVTLFADDPARSAAVWVTITVAAVAAVALVRDRGVAEWTVWGLCTAVTAASIAADLIGVDRSLGRLAGVTFEPNTLAHISGLGALVAIHLFNHRRVRPILAASVMAAAWVLWESETRTIFAALAVGVGLSVLRSSIPRHTQLVLAVLAIASIGAALGDIEELGRRSDTEDLSALSGRSLIWERSWELISDSPVTGSGLGSGPADLNGRAIEDGQLLFSPSSHSLPLEIARETGIIGLGLALYAVAGAHRRRQILFRPVGAYLLVASLTMPTTGFAGVVALAWFVELQRSVPSRAAPHELSVTSLDSA